MKKRKKSKVRFLDNNYFDRYYFSVTTNKEDILVHREGKQAALAAFQHYQSVGKKVEWKGKWTGRVFEETDLPYPLTAA
ncbi:MAG: hypothetical protein AAGJ18_00960 [Bacteroidota bacterium]